MGREGFAVVSRQGASPTNDVRLAYGFTATVDRLAYYSVPQRRKLTGKPKEGQFESFLVVSGNPESDTSKGNLSIGAGWRSISNGPPISLRMELAPVVFVAAAHPAEGVCQIEKGVLALRDDEGEFGLRADASTGRLLEWELLKGTNGSGVTLRSEGGGFARLAKELESAGAGFAEVAVSERPLSDSLQMLARDFDAGIAAPAPMILDWIGQPFGGARGARDLLDLLGRLGEQAWREVLEPLDSLASKVSRASADSDFPFVLDTLPTLTPQGGDMVRAVGGILLRANEDCWQRGSWPWAIVRDATFLMAGETTRGSSDIQRLLRDPATGPLGCLMAARSLGRLDPGLAVAFAQRGAIRSSSPEGLKADLKLLLRGDAAGQQLLRRALQGSSRLTESDLQLAARIFGTNALPVFVEAFLRIKSNPSLSVDEAVAPVVDKNWVTTIRPRLLAAFSDAVLGVPKGPGVSAESLPMAEVASWLEEAAQAGLAYAQISVGKFYAHGLGVTPDREKAIAWILKAEQQGFPHAACELGRIYAETGDRAKAIQWFRRGAKDACYAAEMGLAQVRLKGSPKPSKEEQEEAMNALRSAAGHGSDAAYLELASILEAEGKMDEAVESYRSAARRGVAQAQAKLGELLSDGFSVRPDNVEAFVWLKLASAHGDRMAGVQLKSVQRRLTRDQLEEAGRRFKQMEKQIDAKENP